MKIYLAAPLTSVTHAKAVAERLRLDGHDVVSTWHDTVAEGQRDPLDVPTRREVALQCLHEVEQADALVALLDDEGARPRGTFIEVGFAVAACKPIVWIGGQHTVFDALANVTHCDANMDHLPAALSQAWAWKKGRAA